MRALLSSPTGGHERVATVLLPGIMGSLLASTRGISTLLWLNPTIIANGYINLLDLDDEGTGDRSPDVDVVPVGIEKFVYLKLILTLARETRLYEFPYDWRRRLEWNADLLAQAIDRWAAASPERRFILVGHSMGGMLARTYLARHPAQAERQIERLVMLGSPIYGAPDAVMVFWGQSLASRLAYGLHPGNDAVRFASNLPSTYQLLPPPPELFPAGRPYPVDWDLYDASAWGLDTIRQDHLDAARRLHDVLAHSDPQVPCVQIAGCNQQTLTDVSLRERATLSQLPVMIHTEQGQDSGDDTVPIWSSTAAGIPTYYVEERHHYLPAIARCWRLCCISSTTKRRPAQHGAGAQRGAPSPLAAPLVQQIVELRQRIEEGRFSREDLEKIFFAR